MDTVMRLKAVAILICAGMASVAAAENNPMNTNTNGNQTIKTATIVSRPDDATLTKNVKAAISDYADKVNVAVKDGVVSLSGEIPSDTDYDKLITEAESVKGVKDVKVDQITVKESNNPLYDTYITAKVKGALIQSDIMGADIPSWTVSVETKNGEVYLSGTVKSEQERQNVINIVQSVKGVNKVDDEMEVVGSAPNAAPGTSSSDQVPQTSNTTNNNTETNSPSSTTDNSSSY